MIAFIELMTNFVNAVALLMALVFLVSILNRKQHTTNWKHVILGALFSATVLLTMSDPIDLGSNGGFDMRGLLIGTGVALLGPVVGLMAAMTALVYRLIIGGPGLASGIALIAGAYAGGWLWRSTIPRLKINNWTKSVLLGLFISAQSVGILFAPPHMQYAILTGLVPYIVLSNIIGAVIICYLLSGELSFLSRAQTARKESHTDHLTGLLNRRGLEVAYPDLAPTAGKFRGRALLYFDVDRFKRVNDENGHKVGDSILRHVAKLVSENLRPDDVFARLGGDEFAVILNHIDIARARSIAERCRRVVAEDQLENVDLTGIISISVGAVWEINDPEIDYLLDQADAALYQAKSNGRNCVIFAQGNEPTMQGTIRQHA